ncbi:MAG TPA: extracellular solute-binding protein [Candidatus Binatia bacterium]
MASKPRTRWFTPLAFLALFPSAASGDWKQEWESAVQAAKKEGQVTVYVYRYEAAFDAFRAEYPEIKLNAVSATGAQLGMRIMAERRGGKYLADVFSSGANTNFNVLYKGKALEPLKPLLLLPEVVDESKWFGGRHRYIDPEAKYILAYIGNSSGSGQLSYHIHQADPKEFQSFWDLVQPKWKGKIVSLDPANTGLGASMQFYYYNPELGPEWIKRFFGSMEITFSREFRQMTDWLAQGRFALCMGCKDVDRARQQGLPVASLDEVVWKEGRSFSSAGGTLSLLKNAPHPNAARVFINWYLSRKGQLALQNTNDPFGSEYRNSLRIDISKDTIPPAHRLVEGVKYFDVTRPEFSDMAPIFKLAKEITKGKE